ncbi:MAG: tetratricopeptide repeat protein [Candidatus Hydrogenedens sp.]|jgi:tetratricopeptide (TPR) repeat protein|nr:tetratricopeptide repeat protein [Candidatus Hydrogenedens sp.]
MIFKSDHLILFILAASLIAGCSSHKTLERPEILHEFKAPAFSLSVSQEEMTVAVSPVRQTLQIGGTMTALLGAGISALQDGHHARRVHEALYGFDCTEQLKEKLTEALEEAFSHSFTEVTAQGSMAGFHSIQEARKARFEGLNKRGYDAVLDLEGTYGIYGAEGLLVLRLKGELQDLAGGKRLWRNTLTAYSMDLYEGIKWKDPMDRLTPNIMSPRFSSGRDAIDQWTTDGGAPLRQGFEKALQELIAALLCDLGVEESATGLAVLGTNALLDGKKSEAHQYFQRAQRLNGEDPDIANGLALSLARMGDVEQGIVVAQESLASHPDFQPLYYNLAWWYGVNLKQPDEGREYYEKALALGARPARRLKRAYGN